MSCPVMLQATDKTNPSESLCVDLNPADREHLTLFPLRNHSSFIQSINKAFERVSAGLYTVCYHWHSGTHKKISPVHLSVFSHFAYLSTE